MRRGRRTLTALLRAGVLAFGLAAAATAQDAGGVPEPEPSAPAWEFGASLFGYFVPQDRDYASPIVTADHSGGLHLEGRYNYEGIHTGSVFVGWNFGGGEKLKVNAVGMVGGVFGDTKGVAPGYELTLSWKSFELYSEGEYVVDVNDSSANFFYAWNQIGYSPLDWLTAGIAMQRTRAYHTELDVQRGLFLGLTHKNVSLHVYVFNFGWESPTVVSSLSMTF